MIIAALFYIPVNAEESGAHIVNSKNIMTESDFILIKGGCFKMGDTSGDGDGDEQPVHEVCVDSFFMDKYEITQAQWKEQMGTNPSSFSQGDKYPVENVSWDDVKIFIKRLNSVSKTNYRLPTEAEWEYAARGSGHSTALGKVGREQCNFYETGQRDKWANTAPVGSFLPNEQGLFDMCGNVWELVEDNYSYTSYQHHSQRNPLYRDLSSDRVARGCGWSDSTDDCHITIRNKVSQDCEVCSRRNDTGFRLVRDID